MIEADVSGYIIGAYAVALVLLGAITLAVILNARHWAKRARALERKP